MTIEVNRFKGSSHPTKPGGLYIGVVRAVIGIGKITVYVPRLENTFANLSILNAQIDNPVVVGDQVVVGHLDNGTDEMVVFGYLFPKQSVAGDAVTASPLSQFAPTTSAQLASVISNETGTGSLVFANSPALITPTGIVKNDVGLGNVDNTADTAKPVSTAQQTALNLKANLASPTFTGTVTIPSGSSISLPNIDNFRLGYTTTATSGGTTILTNSSNNQQVFTGVTTHTVTMPTASSMTVGTRYLIENNSTGNITVNSSGGNLISTVLPGTSIKVTSILATGTTAASWDAEYVGFNNITGTGSVVMSASPTFIGIPSAPTAAAGTNSSLLATTAFVTAADNLKANLASPTFTGTPLSTTAAADTNSTQIATTAYVVGQGYSKLSGATFSGTLAGPSFTTGVNYGSYGGISLVGVGNNGYQGIASSSYSCAVMWNATIFGHYLNNNTWNFYFQSGTLNNSGNVVSGGYVAAGGSGVTDAGSVSATNWFRSTGNTGWYNQTHGGGIYMEDSTWVRVYNSKNFYSNAQIRSNFFSCESTDVSASADYIVRDGGAGRFYIKSSRRDLKENIQPIPNALNVIDKLSPQIFNWKMSDEDKQDEYQILTKQTYKTMGFILEDIVDVSPELVTWRKKEEDSSLYPGYWKTDDFIALAIQGIKDLSKKVSDLESQILILKEQK